MQPASAPCFCPIISRTEYTLVDIDADGGFLTLMSESGDETREDLKLPTYPEGMGDEISAAFDEGKQLILTVLKSMGEEQVISWKEDTTEG